MARRLELGMVKAGTFKENTMIRITIECDTVAKAHDVIEAYAAIHSAFDDPAERVEAELAKPDANLAELEKRMDDEDNQGVPVAHSDATAREVE